MAFFVTIVRLGICQQPDAVLEIPQIESASDNKNTVMGVSIISSEEKEKLCKGKLQVKNPDKVDYYLSINGKQIPYDKYTSTLYISQDDSSTIYVGTLSVNVKEVEAYWIGINDDYKDIKMIMNNGNSIPLLLLAKDSYSVLNVVFTSLPVIQIQTETSLLNEYELGVMSVFDFNNISQASEYIEIKESDSKEVITVKTRYTNGKKKTISLLNLEPNDTFKLYSIKSDDPFRMMLALQLWNKCSQINELRASCKYVELIENNRYKGLYIIRPRIDKDYFSTSKEFYNINVIDTNDMELEDIPRDLYQNDNIENLSDYYLFMQGTYAYVNLFEDVKIIESMNGSIFVTPGKIEYAFGKFPSRYDFLSYNFETRIITAEDFGLQLEDEKRSLFEQNNENRWKKARESFLCDREIESELNEYANELRVSGYAARNGMTDVYNEASDPIPDEMKIYGDKLEAYQYHLFESTRIRFRNIDQIYNVLPNTIGTSVLIEAKMDTEEIYELRNEGFKAPKKQLEDRQGFNEIYFRLEKTDYYPQIKMYIDGPYAYLFLPSFVDYRKSSICIVYNENEYDVIIEGEHVNSGSIVGGLIPGGSKDIEIVYKQFGNIYYPDGEHDYYTLVVMQSSMTPALFIDTANGTMEYLNLDKNHIEPGKLLCIDSEGVISAKTDIRKMHMRGHTSVGSYQRSYNISLSNDVDLLGMGKAKKWRIIGSGIDSTRLRNPIAYRFALDIELENALDFRLVDIYYNGEYNGLVLLIEHIEVAENRVNPNRVEYLFKLDNASEDSPIMFYPFGRDAELLYPEEIAPKDLVELQEKTDKTIRKIYTCKTEEQFVELHECVDVDSFAKLYIINAITNEADTNGPSMFYYWEDGKLFAGPVWDFDRSAGNEYHWRGSDYRINSYGSGYAEILMMNCPAFRVRIKEIALQYKEEIDSVIENVIYFSNTYKSSLDMTRIRFPGQLTSWVVKETISSDFGDLYSDITYLKSVYNNRIDLIWDTIVNPENYHRVLISGGNQIVWMKKNECFSEKLIDGIKLINGWSNVMYVGGGNVSVEIPIVNDMVLIGE